MLDISRHLTRSKQWMSRLVLISFTLHLIRFSALPARPLPVNRGKPHGATIYSGAQLSLDICDRSNSNHSTVLYEMSTPNGTATNIGSRPRLTISSFPSLLLTPSDFNSRSTASSGASFRVNSTTTESIPINQDRSESNHVVGSTNNNVLSLPKFFDDDCQLRFLPSN